MWKSIFLYRNNESVIIAYAKKTKKKEKLQKMSRKINILKEKQLILLVHLIVILLTNTV